MKIMCPRCGANTTFVPNEQKCYCEYCGSLVEVNEISDAFKEKQKDIKTEQGEYDEYSCVSCGAKLLTTDGSIITDCVYCGSRQLTKTKSKFYHQPVEIVPFRIDRNYFLKSCYEYVKNSNELPADYKDKLNKEKIIASKGIYIPCKKEWYKINSNVKTKIYYANNLKTQNKYAYYEIDIQKEVLAIQDASSKISDNILEQIENYDFKQTQKFNSAFLTGFIVENANEAEETVKIKAERKCIDTLKQDINECFKKDKGKIGVIQKIMGKVNFKALSSANVLLPVWFARLGKLEFIMNGQTGKMYCITPFAKPQYKYDDNKKVGNRRIRIEMIIAGLLLAGIPLAVWVMLGAYYSSIWELLGILGVFLFIILVCVITAIRPDVKRAYEESSPRNSCANKI